MRAKHYISVFTIILLAFFSSYPEKLASAANKGIISIKPGKDVLQKAIDKASEMQGDVVIELNSGEYRLNKTANISQGKWNSLTIKGKDGAKVSIAGDKIIPLNRMKHVSDPEILSLLPEESRGKVMEVSCKGIVDHLDNIHAVGYGREGSFSSWSELMVDDTPLQLSRWPNDTMSLIGNVVVKGDNEDKKAGRLPIFHFVDERPCHWKNTSNMWISGYFTWGWADDMIPVKSIDLVDSTIHAGMFSCYEFRSGAFFRRWFAVNLLEEMDKPGEYVIDTVKMKFYFYPASEKIGKARLTVLKDPLISIRNCRNVSIKGITIQNSQGMGVYMDNTENVIVENCKIRNLGNVGVRIGKLKPSGKVPDYEAGENNGVKDCYIYDTGSGGVFLCGGDRLTLTPGNNYVENCIITRVNRIEKSYHPGITIHGVGNRVTKCEIYDAPSMAILFHGNDQVIEYCDIHDVCKEIVDQGAVYHGRDPSARGTIIRYNYFHDLSMRQQVSATYHDDGECGSTVYGNIYFRTGTKPSLIGGGSDNHYYGNIFMDCPIAFHVDNRLENWAKSWVTDENGDKGLFRERLEAVGYNKPPYSTKYPELAKYFEDNPAHPKRNRIEGNLFYKIGNLLNSNGKTEWLELWNNWMTNEEPGFVDPSQPLKGFKPDAEVFRKIQGFKEIPCDAIGPDLDPGKMR